MSAPSPARCETCGRKPNEAWMCSHVDCPNRKPETAAPPEHLEAGRVPPRINDGH